MGIVGLLWQLLTLGASSRAATLRNQVAVSESMGEHLDRLERALDEEIERGKARDAEIALLRSEVRSLRSENDELRHKLTQCDERHECDLATIRELRAQLESNNAKIALLERRLLELTGGNA
jgi:chromosome segregation ATPase